MKTIVLILLGLLLALGGKARPFDLTFIASPSVAQGIVAGNFAYYNGTNDYRNTYVGCSSAVGTNIYFDSTNIAVNPCFFHINTTGTNGLVSTNSVPFLFDTNNYPLPAATSNSATNVTVLFPAVITGVVTN